MKDEKAKKVVEIGNKLIEALRVEADYNPDEAIWELEEKHIKWISENDLINLTQLSHEFSNRCLELESEIDQFTVRLQNKGGQSMICKLCNKMLSIYEPYEIIDNERVHVKCATER